MHIYIYANVFLKLRRWDAYPSIKLHHCQTLQSLTAMKMWKVLQTRHATVENKDLMSKQLIEKLTKYKKLGSPTNETSRKKIQSKIINLSKRHLTKIQISLSTKEPKFCPTTKGNVFDIKSDTKEFTRKLKLRERFWGIEYNDESLVKSKSNINVNTAIQELSNISNILEQIKPTISNVNDNLTKQERKALKELQEDQDLVIRKADKGNTLVLMDKDYYCGTLVMKQHLSTSTYQKVDSNSDKRVFNNLKILMKKHKSCLTKDELKYILNSNWKSSNFYVLRKIHNSKKIIEEINESHNICLNMQPPKDLKGRPIVGGPNSPTRGISALLEKILTPIVSCLKTYVKDDWDFIRKLPSHVDYPCVLASCDVVSLYTSIPHDLGLEALSYWIDKKRNLIPERFTKAFVLEAASFVLSNNNFQFDIYMFLQLVWYCNGYGIWSTLCMS